MNISLIGGRGVGKTLISTILAKKLSYNLFHLDDLIEYEVGLTISEMVEEKGWNFFRDVEYQVVQKATQLKNVVLNCGGGVVVDLDSQNREIFSERKVTTLKNNSLLILLECDVQEQVRRIKDSLNRPSLTERNDFKKELAEVMKRRKNFYHKAADHTVRTDQNNPEEVVDYICKFINQNKRNFYA